MLKVIGKKMTRKALAMIKSLADAEKKGDGEEEEEEEEGEGTCYAMPCHTVFTKQAL